MVEIEHVVDPAVKKHELGLHPHRGSILRSLERAGTSISFKGIAESTNIKPSLCAYHLKFLHDRGMVERTFSHSNDRKDFSFYHLTKKGEEALRLEEALIRPPNTVEGTISLVAWKNMPRCFIVRRS